MSYTTEVFAGRRKIVTPAELVESLVAQGWRLFFYRTDALYETGAPFALDMSEFPVAVSDDEDAYVGLGALRDGELEYDRIAELLKANDEAAKKMFLDIPYAFAELQIYRSWPIYEEDEEDYLEAYGEKCVEAMKRSTHHYIVSISGSTSYDGHHDFQPYLIDSLCSLGEATIRVDDIGGAEFLEMK